MTQKEILNNITELDLLDLADKYNNVTNIITDHFGFSKKYGYIIKEKMLEYDIQFLNTKRKTNTIYQEIIKICPICNKKFNTKVGSSKEKTVCSRACANTYFRSGINNPNYKGKDYRKLCFNNYDKKCAICNEVNILDVHHIDGNHNNNSINNLIPLCPTHHRYIHSKFYHLIEQDINKWIENEKYNK